MSFSEKLKRIEQLEIELHDEQNRLDTFLGIFEDQLRERYPFGIQPLEFANIALKQGEDPESAHWLALKCKYSEQFAQSVYSIVQECIKKSKEVNNVQTNNDN